LKGGKPKVPFDKESKGKEKKPRAIGDLLEGKSVVSKIRLWLAPRVRELRFSLYLMSKSVTSIAGLIILAFLLILVVLPWVFAAPNGVNPYKMPFNTDYQNPLPPGEHGYILGSGRTGADYFYGIIWGARNSMEFAIEIVLVSAIIGTILGLIAGYRGGVIDEIIMRITDVFLSIPSLVLVMAIAAILGRNLESTKLALLAVWWSGYTRIIRGQVLSIRENTYIDAARAAGSGDLKIMFRHILPNSWSPMVVNATMDMGTVVLVMAGLSYLGLGAEYGTCEWGSMIQEGQRWLVYGAWWMIVFPGIMILLFVLAFNLIGDGLRDILDPRMRR
jgi:peptide/nickel transport system permease protein